MEFAQKYFKNPSGKEVITLKAEKNFQIFLEDFEGGNRDFELVVEMESEGLNCEITGRIICQGEDRKSWRITQVYKGVNQKGHLQLRGIAEDSGTLSFEGGAVLEKSSIQADAEVTQRIILFNEAKGQGLPILTVKTDNVKAAGHGASIAPIDEEILLYCASRGLNTKNTQELIKEGFLQIQEKPLSSNRR